MRLHWRTAILLLAIASFATSIPRKGVAQNSEQELQAAADSDQDGLSDALEQALLIQFAPRFMIGRQDCSQLPAEFIPDLADPTVNAEDGTIYGQVFLARSSTPDHPSAEIHFYHLWRSDCGPHSHPLDAEHVAVLVSATDRNLDTARWKALYWYAAAHEDTVCDVSQIARASTLRAERTGATIFISLGKHASYFNETLCKAGCGSDKCVDMVVLRTVRMINLGEPAHTMNGSAFVASNQWPLIGKMSKTDFPPEPIARLNQLPDSDVAWFNRGRHPAQGIIAVSGSTQQTLSIGADSTTASIAAAGESTGSALSRAQESTGDALQKTCLNTAHAVGTSARKLGEALHLVKKTARAE